MFPAMVIRYNMGWMEMLLVDLPLFLGATTSVCSFYAFAQRQAFGAGSWRNRLKYIPGVLALGIGLSVNNARAVIEGLFGKRSEFVRTPKLGISGPTDEWRQKRYRMAMNRVAYAELALACYFIAMAFYAVGHGLWASVPFVLIFLSGYLYTSLLSLVQGLERPFPIRPLGGPTERPLSSTFAPAGAARAKFTESRKGPDPRVMAIAPAQHDCIVADALNA